MERAKETNNKNMDRLLIYIENEQIFLTKKKNSM
jgi:hypothetical protein